MDMAKMKILKSPSLWSLALLAGLVGGVFWGELRAHESGCVLGSPGADMASQFLAWRSFGFGELAHGRFPLWNPGVFSGAPYFGGAQAALLYPPNVVFLFLPLAAAINASEALHAWMMGAFVFAWARGRRLGAPAACFAGTLAMFSGAYIPHVYAGHLSNLCAMPWAALIFLAIDGWMDRRRAAWALLGMGAVAMQALAGHPQYVYYTAIAAGLYAVARSFQARRKAGAMLGVAAMYLGGTALAAVQLFASVGAFSETVRHGALPWEFAARFGLPVENLLTLAAPGVLGKEATYWGRWFPRETTFFVGVTGACLAVYALVDASGRRRAWPLATTLAATTLLALGSQTPLFGLCYRFLPGFASFRGTSKFIFPATLCLAMMAGIGLDRLRKRPVAPRGFVIGVGLLALALGLVCCWTWSMPMASWRAIMERVHQTGEAFFDKAALDKRIYVLHRQAGAANAMMVAASSAAGVALLVAMRRRWGRASVNLLALAGAWEVVVFATGTMSAFNPSLVVNESLKKALAKDPGDARVAMLDAPNNAMLLGAKDIWGNDPCVTRRYAEFIAWTQGNDPNRPTQDVKFARVCPLYAMLRLGRVIKGDQGDYAIEPVPTKPLPHALVVGSWNALPGRDAIFAEMSKPGFDPWRRVLLDRDSRIVPATGGAGTPGGTPVGAARVIAEDSDSLTIEAETTRPAILLVTDAWTPAWRARALPGSAQARYDVVPADYCLRGVPLTPGRHRLIMEYAPRAFVVGAWVSAFAALIYLAAWGWTLRPRRLRARAGRA
jgi:hypothetical protein